MDTQPPRNLGLDMVRATEDAAVAAGRFMGRSKPDEADKAATDAMYHALDTLDMQGHVVIGEEPRRDFASPLDTDQVVGTKEGPEMDVVIDPIDGRRLLSLGQSGAISVAAIAPRGCMWSPKEAIYMEKIVVDQEVGDALVEECLDAPAAWTLSLIARSKEKDVKDLVVFILDRPRHGYLIDEIRTAGARVMLRVDGDIYGALLAASEMSKADVLMGIGGVPEGIISAAAVKSLGGSMLGRLQPQSEEENRKVEEAGLDIERILSCDDIVSSDEIFFAVTGITDGPLLDGVSYRSNWAQTHSFLLRCETMTRRFIRAEHALNE